MKKRPSSTDAAIKECAEALGFGARRHRVLYYIVYPQRIAGANRGLLELVSHLPSNIKAIVVLTAEGPVADAFRSAGIETKVIVPPRSLQQYGGTMLRLSRARLLRLFISSYLPYFLKMRRVLRTLRVEIVQTNDVRGTLLIGPAARLAGCKTVAHIRGEKNPFSKAMWWGFEQIPHRFIVCSKNILTDLSSAARARSLVVNDGTEDISGRGQSVPWLAELRAKGIIVVSCFASVVPFKGQHHLLEAVAELNDRGWRDRVVFVCVGDLIAEYRDYQEWLVRRQNELHVDNVYFVGWQADPFSYYRMSDINVLPSVSKEQLRIDDRVIEVRGGEGFPLSHLEAMCYGLPIVGTNIAGVSEQVRDGVTGFVVPPSDSLALADSIERLLADGTLRARMGAAARERVLSRFSTSRYVCGVLKVYSSLLHRSTRKVAR